MTFRHEYGEVIVMKIQCLPRKWFELIKGTVLEEQVLAHNKAVSVQSRSVWDSEPPLSKECLKMIVRFPWFVLSNPNEADHRGWRKEKETEPCLQSSLKA